MPKEIEKWSPTQKAIYKTFLGSPLKLWASVGHWWIWHFDLAKYTEKQKPRVSAARCAGCCFLLPLGRRVGLVDSQRSNSCGLPNHAFWP
jgi:hypothetical protein